jgi:hypothetical protein
MDILLSIEIFRNLLVDASITMPICKFLVDARPPEMRADGQLKDPSSERQVEVQSAGIARHTNVHCERIFQLERCGSNGTDQVDKTNSTQHRTHGQEVDGNDYWRGTAAVVEGTDRTELKATRQADETRSQF